MRGETQPKDCISELVEMEAVMRWASQNVQLIERGTHTGRWYVQFKLNDADAPTLYQAIKAAWEKRDE